MKTKTTNTPHTPAPWFAVESRGKDQFHIRVLDTEDGYSVMDCDWVGYNKAKANATLMAAAPELLEALENLLFLNACEQEGIESGRPTAKQWFEAFDKAEQAVDKAKGLTILENEE